MKKKLRKPKGKPGNVFWKAVEGYKKMEEKREKEIKEIVVREVKEKPEPEKPKKKLEGIKIEEGKITYMPREEKVDLTTINIIYPLIPRKSKTPFASANIRWSKGDTALVYYIIEPELIPTEQDLLKRIKNSLIEKLDVDFTTLGKGEAREYLKARFEEMVNLMGQHLTPEKRRQILYYVERDFIGLGKIEPLMQDPEIEDISCDGVGIPIFVLHRNSVFGSMRTNIKFDTAEEADIFVNKLAQRCGKTVSVARPLIGASLPDGSRVQATLGTDIARKGSNFTIRKFTEDPMTPVHIINFKTMDPKIAAYMWLAVEYGRSILITGGVATGKTTLLNALSLFIKPELKVISIEDTPEIRLPHPHWVPHVARQPIAEISGRKLGEVDLFDLLRESLRQRPDYLIVGEVRGRETYVLFQQISTGHAGMSTIHADSIERLMDRLTTPPISLPASLIGALDIIIFLVRIKHGNSYVRRIQKIYEIIGFDREKNIPITNEVFNWDPRTDSYKAPNPSIVLKKISEQYGIQENFLQNEISKRIKVLNWLIEKNIGNFRDVARVIKLYYTRPDDLLDAI